MQLPSISMQASFCALCRGSSLSIVPELEVVAPLSVDAGTVLGPTDVADTAWADEIAATRPKPLLAVLQHVVVEPLMEQQKSPSLTAAPWHSTTQLASPNTNISFTQPGYMGTIPTGSAECRADCRLVGTVCTTAIVIYQVRRHTEPIGEAGLANFAAERGTACLRIARPVVWKRNGIWAGMAVTDFCHSGTL